MYFSINTPFQFISKQSERRGEDEITFAFYTKVIPWSRFSRDCWRKVDSEIQCLLWSLNVMKPKYPHIFPDTLSLLHSGPASRPYVLGFTLPKPLACLLQTTTSYHRTPAAQRGPEARPLVYPTLMALFSNSEPFAAEPSTLQESNLTWRPGEHSHRFHTTGTGQIAPASLSTTVYLFTSYLIVIQGFQVARCP